MLLFGKTKFIFGKRLLKNKGAFAGLLLIGLSVLLALFAYVIAPDHSPDANRIIPEIGSKKPGFSVQMLQIKKGQAVKKISFLQQRWYGAEDSCRYIPVTSCEWKGDSIIYQKFVDEGLSERHSVAVTELCPEPPANLSTAKERRLFLHKALTVQHFYLGSDKFGRDLLSRLVIGTRVSLSVGLIAVILSLTIGILLGCLAGYFRGWTDDLIMWLTNVIWSIPTLLLVFAITLVLGKGFWQVFIAVGLTMWVNVARLVRGQVLALRELEFIEAAKALGYSGTRIIFRHLLPNIAGPVIVIASSNFASAIVVEAGLSFLGVGVQPPQPSWGLMMKENYNFIITHNPMLALAPGLAIMLLVLAFNLLGNGLRDVLNVKQPA